MGNEPVPQNDMEVIMPHAKEMVKDLVQMNIQMNEATTNSKEKVTLQGMAYQHKERLITFGIIVAIALIGAVSGTIMLANGRTEIGFPIISSTITGIFGFLGGKSLGRS